ncbi:uncharacterized protein LOC126896840 isoform X4 [Daktulosphaira vitifoliae]|nr:uncharacterized protein LOC126896840 isoform X4 [Daktulosphaira vitifoliae]
MNCCFRPEPNFDHAVGRLKICIETCGNVPLTMTHITKIEELKRIVKDFPCKYRCSIKKYPALDKELAEKLCGREKSNNSFMTSMKTCAELFRKELNSPSTNPEV